MENRILKLTNLRGADLRGVDLRGADLYGADLRGADLRGADLCEADLREADLRGADLCEADLREANLRGADLRGADLCEADLRGADLTDAKYKTFADGYNLSCPEQGAFIGFKKLREGKIAKLLIPEDAKRSSATSRKCRCDKALVIEIVDKAGKKVKTGMSQYDVNFIYEIDKEVKADNFDNDRWNECSNGIHFFITKEEAENY